MIPRQNSCTFAFSSAMSTHRNLYIVYVTNQGPIENKIKFAN